MSADHREVTTQSERRANAAPEVAEYIRGARSPANIPSFYSDISREISRSWKTQRKGRKAWDR